MLPAASPRRQRQAKSYVNRVLDKFIPIAGTRFIEKPDGVASPGDFHLRYVTHTGISAIFTRAADMGIVPHAK
jgi:hypothetical protein